MCMQAPDVHVRGSSCTCCHVEVLDPSAAPCSHYVQQWCSAAGLAPLLLPQVRPYLMADGGNVEFVEIDGLVVKLKLKGACGSCPSSLTTMTMGIKRRLMEKIPVSCCGQRTQQQPKQQPCSRHSNHTCTVLQQLVAAAKAAVQCKHKSGE